jgi:hypothetical protein
MAHRIRPIQSLLASLLAIAAGLLPATSTAEVTDDWPFLADTLFPRQHADPRNSDHTPVDGPIVPQHVYSTVTDYALSQPCAEGPGGVMYCVANKDPEEGRCNLSAVDVGTGRLLWEDRVDGVCLLDDATGVSVPLVDADGNVYAGGANIIASFTPEGQLRWTNDIPSRLPSRKGLPNNPFGFNLLTTGELVTATMGDAWVLVIDRVSGSVLAQLDIPAEKKLPAEPPELPLPVESDIFEPWMSPEGSALVVAFGTGQSEFENDNDVTIHSGSDTIWVNSGAPFPNEENKGAIWVVDYDHGSQELSIRTWIPVPGAGSATSPALTEDEQFMVIGGVQNDLIVVDVPKCLALSGGAECNEVVSVDIGGPILASPSINPDNQVCGANNDGVVCFRLGRSEGQITVTEDFFTPVPDLGQPGVLIANTISTVANTPNLIYEVYAQLGPLPLPVYKLMVIDRHTGSLINLERINNESVNIMPVGDGESLVLPNFGILKAILQNLAGLAIPFPLGVDGYAPEGIVAVRGASLIYKDNNKPRNRMLSLELRPKLLQGGLVPPDPRVDGAKLTLLNAETGQMDAIDLPAEHWVQDGPGAFMYSDLARTAGPCTSAELRPIRVAAACAGEQLAFTLGGLPQDALTVGLAVGENAPFCALFGGPDVTRDDGKRFEAFEAPANILCRLP